MNFTLNPEVIINKCYIPLNIWNDDAYVRLSPTYIVLVASISSIAGGKNIKGLKLQTGLSTTAANSFDCDCNKMFNNPTNWMTSTNFIKYLFPLFGKM